MNQSENPAASPLAGALSKEPYKGVRDFYPEDMAVQKYMFGVMRKVAESFGYAEYDASVLEPAELYRAKSGEEIVNEQTYTFMDRGGREVTLRPEMTPTVARMIAARRREIPFPARWYSIPNLFRYEKPQRGRLREHWQLNVDLFGASGVSADAEVIELAASILRAFGLKDSNFEIRLNSRKLMDFILEDVFRLETAGAHAVSKLIDRKDKMPAAEFELKLSEMLREEHVRSFVELLNSKNFEEFVSHLSASSGDAGAIAAMREQEGMKEVKVVLEALEARGITNARFDQTLMRGFDYYNGVVFEIYDMDPSNRRALFGGGRYDGLTTLFEGSEPVAAVGFGMGDVTMRDILETYRLMPKAPAPADVAICTLGEAAAAHAPRLAAMLREGSTGKAAGRSLRVAVNLTEKKVGDQLKWADKQNIARALVIGDDELASKKYSVKDLGTGESKEVAESELVDFLKRAIADRI